MERTPANFKIVSAQLTEINEWLESLGLGSHRRFRRYRDNVEEMLNRQQAMSSRELHDEIASEGRLTEVLASYVEGMEVADTISALRSAGVDIPVDVLKKAVGGPADAATEDETSNAGRNFMFELVIAAAATNGGLKPVLGQAADVTLDFEGRKAVIECKRVLSENKIEQRLRDGARQLKERASGPGDCGIVAISITRTINKGLGFWEIDTLDGVYPFLEERINMTIQRFEPLLKTLDHPSFSAAVFYLATPVLVPGVGFTPVKRGIVYPMPGISDHEYLRGLVGKLKL